MPEVLFYHLTESTLEEALPGLLERSLARGWRAIVQTGTEERRNALDAHLWTFRDDAFLPHGSWRDGQAERQPIWLTNGAENPNGAVVRFLVDGASLLDPADYRRVVYLIDGRDAENLGKAREAAARARQAGHEVTYWRESVDGRWERQA